METSELIKVLSADTAVRQPSFGRAWLLAIGLAVLIAAAIFLIFIRARPDVDEAAETMRFLFKFVVTGLLAVTAIPAMLAFARPETVGRWRIAMIAVAPLVLLGGVAFELMSVPAAEWGTRLIGTNMPYCLTLIPLMGIGPLSLFIYGLRNAAPSRPQLAGAVAGLAAGGIAATMYAAHCTDDSPLFVATWYTLAVMLLTVAGAIAGRRFARW
jgi:hypothetical protein